MGQASDGSFLVRSRDGLIVSYPSRRACFPGGAAPGRSTRQAIQAEGDLVRGHALWLAVSRGHRHLTRTLWCRPRGALFGPGRAGAHRTVHARAAPAAAHCAIRSVLAYSAHYFAADATAPGPSHHLDGRSYYWTARLYGAGASLRLCSGLKKGALAMGQVTRRDMMRWLETHGFVQEAGQGHRTSTLCRPRREDHAARAWASGSHQEARRPDHSRAGARRIRPRADPARAGRAVTSLPGAGLGYVNQPVEFPRVVAGDLP